MMIIKMSLYEHLHLVHQGLHSTILASDRQFRIDENEESAKLNRYVALRAVYQISIFG
jgi:hypothetical protein